MAAPASSSKARRSSPYDDDPMVRLTGLSLDPEFPPQHHHNANGATAAGAVPPTTGTTTSTSPSPAPSAPAKDGISLPAIDTGHRKDQASPSTSPRHAEFDDAALHAEGHAPDGSAYLTLRALVTTREAGVIIGKGGKNVAEIREATGVKAGVSKVVQGVHERILTIAGTVDALSKSMFLVAKHLLDNPVESPRQREPPQPDHTTIRLLVAHQLMGGVIGKAGCRIRDIQEESGAKITVSKDMLPQSTERVIEIYGLASAIQTAVSQICESVLNDIARVTGTIFYLPENRIGRSPRSAGPDRNDFLDSPRSAGIDRRGNRLSSFGEPTTPRRTTRAGSAGIAGANQNVHVISNEGTAEQRIQTLGVPVALVGSIIGRGGSFINLIRKNSGARLRIDEALDGQSERIVTITGTDVQTKTALDMIYSQIETEKQNRLAAAQENEGSSVPATPVAEDPARQSEF
ncbi:RNA binding protein, heterogenous nuclear RNP-K like protein [Thoreauomyces humboldtii]|nr:RNA binding protein, heterogenous nuclear RNP-K like protein [Thoreauomyces humboldtii]